MSFVETSFVIASSHPRELAKFYANVHQVEFHKGFSSSHYELKLSNGLKMMIYSPSQIKSFPLRGRATAICFQKGPSSNPLQILEEWILSLTKAGGNIVEKPNNEEFGAEAWISDPEGNDFLIFVPRALGGDIF